MTENKITFTNLHWTLKTLVVFGYISLAWVLFWFTVGFTLGMLGY